jgi:serine phosphatase RsbU (regulator of sigma subunit)
MPKEDPVVEGFDIAGTSLPAREVGGDHFAYSMGNGIDGLFGVTIFDVSGKGMQAAMSAVFTTGAFAAESSRQGHPADILTRLNKAVYANTKRGHFVAFLLAQIQVHDRTLRFANAGQTKPLIRSGVATRWIDGAGVHFPLGMVQECCYEDQVIHLNSGDVVFLMTDGFTEAMNAKQEQYGLDRMEQLVQSLDARLHTAKELMQTLIREVQAHMGSASQHDDMTLVVIKVL